MTSSFPIGQQRRIDDICNDFEESWRDSVRPDFPFWIAKGDVSIADQLLGQLIAVDVELRHRAGQSVIPAEYSTIHQSAPGIVAECLRSFDKTHGLNSTHDIPAADELTTGETARPARRTGKIGPYLLIRKIGEGGMGSVWLAEQQEPIRRQVALKVIRSGARTAEIISRFQSERQALARMDHSNIARILDAGTTSDHQPYFAMELVQGQTLTAYCDQNRLGIHDRIKLLADVCSGVHHAHQKGIIHRDLKPLNVLVVEVDGVPIPKIIDFGMAKALDNSLRMADESACTAIGQVLGTFKYMSPEQACVEEADIDVRTDVYALGIMLYELLTGSTPLASEFIQGQPLLAILEQVRDNDPVKPSSRVSDSGAHLSAIAELRRTDGARLVRALHGDLDWIVMKALERDLKRRYESVADFSADIHRFLNHEPVLARSPSAVYRVRKFVRKYRVPVLAGSLLVAVLIAGIIGTAWGMIAAQHRAEGERVANEIAQKRLTQVQEGNQMFLRIFTDLDIRIVREDRRPLEAILASRLVDASKKMKGELIDDSLEVAAMQCDLGVTLVDLDFPLDAIPLFEESLQTRKRLLGTTARKSVSALHRLAGAHASAGNWDRARELFDEAYRLNLSELGEDHPRTIGAMYGLASALRHTGDPNLAVPLMEESVRLSKLVTGIADRDTLANMWGLAGLYREIGWYEDALSLCDETYSLMKKHLGENHPDTLSALDSLAIIHFDNGDIDRALPLLEDAYRLRMERLGADHSHTIATMISLARCRVAAGLGAQNIAFCTETLEAVRKEFGEKDVATISAMENLAMANQAAGNLDQAKMLLEQALALGEPVLGHSHGHTQFLLANLGKVCLEAGLLDEAISRLKEVHAENPNFRLYLSSVQLLRKACLLAGRLDEFRELADQHLRTARDLLPPGSPLLSDVLEEAGSQFEEIKDHLRAAQLLRECIVIREDREPDSWVTFHARSLLGTSLVGLEQFDEAEPLLVAAYEGLIEREEQISPEQKGCIEQAVLILVFLYEATNRPVEAETWRRKLQQSLTDR